MLFRAEFHPGLADGSITLSFRRWSSPRVKVGGRYRTPVGALHVDSVKRVRVREISGPDARHAGFPDRASLLRFLEKALREPLDPGTELYRVEFHHAGANPAGPPARDAALSPEDVALLSERLARMDRLSRHGPWTARTLALIERHPRLPAARLAARVRRETHAFKADVRKLKRLGLTLSHEVGYEISPRGRAFLSASGRPSGTEGGS